MEISAEKLPVKICDLGVMEIINSESYIYCRSAYDYPTLNGKSYAHGTIIPHWSIHI